MLSICNKLFTCWNEKSIRYCHWKSNEHLVEGLNGETDLDIYVLPIDKGNAEVVLSSLMFVKCVIQQGHRYPNVDEWMGFDQQTGKLVHVHLHYQIITGTKYCKEYVFPIDDLIVSTRVKDPQTNVYITNPNLEIIILFCRIALKAKNHNKIKPDRDDLKEIVFLKNNMSGEVLDYCNLLLDDAGEELYSYINKDTLTIDDWRVIYSIAYNWLKPYRKYSKFVVYLRYHYFKSRFYIVYGLNKFFGTNFITKKTFPSKGISICFLGQDGSGKSTLTIDLCKWFNWKIDAKRFYLGSGDHYNGLVKRIIPRLSGLVNGHESSVIKESANSDNKTKCGKGKRFSMRSTLSGVVNGYSLMLISRRAYKEVKKAEKYKVNHGIALFDRFPQNQFQALYDGPKIRCNYLRDKRGNWIIKFLSNLEERYINDAQQYQPDVVFKLILPVAESMRRKPEENQKQVEKKAEITKRLIFEKSKVFVVDATQDYCEEVLFIKRQIWKEIASQNI